MPTEIPPKSGITGAPRIPSPPLLFRGRLGLCYWARLVHTYRLFAVDDIVDNFSGNEVQSSNQNNNRNKSPSPQTISLSCRVRINFRYVFSRKQIRTHCG
jgi:hypothetical protein